jgi:hypothetical protein
MTQNPLHSRRPSAAFMESYSNARSSSLNSSYDFDESRRRQEDSPPSSCTLLGTFLMLVGGLVSGFHNQSTSKKLIFLSCSFTGVVYHGRDILLE